MHSSLNTFSTCKELYSFSETSFSVFKKGVKCLDLGGKWGNYLYPSHKMARFMKKSSVAYRCTYLPIFIFDSIELFNWFYFFCKVYFEGKDYTSEDWKKNKKNTYQHLGKFLKDCYSINRLREELSGLRQSPISHLFGGALLMSKGVESGCYLGDFLCNYSDRIKRIEDKSKEGPNIRRGLYQDLFFKVLGSMCWIVSCAITGLCFSYALPLKQIVLCANTFGFTVSLFKSFNTYYFNL